MDSPSQKKDLQKLMPCLGHSMENHLGMKFLPTDEDGTIHAEPAMVGDTVHASGKLVHRGSTTHIWDIAIRDSEDHLISVVRVVNYIQGRK